MAFQGTIEPQLSKSQLSKQLSRMDCNVYKSMSCMSFLIQMLFWRSHPEGLKTSVVDGSDREFCDFCDFVDVKHL